MVANGILCGTNTFMPVSNQKLPMAWAFREPIAERYAAKLHAPWCIPLYCKQIHTRNSQPQRRNFLGALGTLWAGAASAQTTPGTRRPATGSSDYRLPQYSLRQDYESLKQSSYDHTGGNSDRWPIAPGETKEIFNACGSGVVSHIWFTIASPALYHLKELVLRMYWDGAAKPSVECPIGDFFGLNLGQYVIYQSAFLNCSSIRALNCYFAMPFRKSGRFTVTNEGAAAVGSFYSNIDYQMVPSLPEDALYFHAQYRQATPNRAVQFPPGGKELNPDGASNYVFLETKGRGT
jgi:Protein of unknown function (DUF2961)